MLRDAEEISIRRKERVALLNTGSGNQTIDGSYLHPFCATSLPQHRCGNVRLSFKGNQGKRLEVLNKPIELFLVPQTIQQLLQDISGQEDSVVSFNVSTEGANIGTALFHLGPPEHH